MNLFSIAQSGLDAASAQLNVAAQNVAAGSLQEPQPGEAGAPAPTPSLSLVQFALPGGGVGTDVQQGGPDDPVADVLNEMQAFQAFKANLRIFQAGEETFDATLKMTA